MRLFNFFGKKSDGFILAQPPITMAKNDSSLTSDFKKAGVEPLCLIKEQL